MLSNNQMPLNDQISGKPSSSEPTRSVWWQGIQNHLKTFSRSKVGKQIEISGMMDVPEDELPKYLLTMKKANERKDLDLLIKPEDSRYFPTLCAIASEIAYERKPFIEDVLQKQWKMKLLEAKDFWNEYQQKLSTKAFMVHDQTANHDMIVVAFRGTRFVDADAWDVNINISACNFGQGIGIVHSGFIEALGLPKDGEWHKTVKQDDDRPLAYYTIREKLTEFFREHPRTKFILTGHSLGGALAILFSALLILHEESDILKRLEAVYTFGQPRVGDKKFGEFMEGKFKEYGNVRYFRFVFSDDAIPRLPPENSSFMFYHFGPWLYYKTNNKGKKLDKDPLGDYFSVGSYMKRSWHALKRYEFRRLLFDIPGVTTHGIREYINAIQNGNTDILQ